VLPASSPIAGSNFAFDVERLELTGHVFSRETHLPNPLPEATVCTMTRGYRRTGRNRFDRATCCFSCRFEQWDTEANSVVAEKLSSEPTTKNYSLREKLAQHRGILRWLCGRFEQSDTGEGCGVAWRRECQSIPIDVQAVFHFSLWEPTVLATNGHPLLVHPSSVPAPQFQSAVGGRRHEEP
jgi:hypothetical protein